MKISYTKSCFTCFLTISSDNEQIILSSDEENANQWIENLDTLKNILSKLVKNFKPEDLSRFYRTFFESDYYDEIDYENPIKESHEEIILRIEKGIKEYKIDQYSYSIIKFLEMFEDSIQSFPQENYEDTHYYCETCGDTNFKLVADWFI